MHVWMRCTLTYLHLEGWVDGSSLTGFCSPLEAIKLLPATSPPTDTDETRSNLPAGNAVAGPIIRLSGADLVDVRGGLEPGDTVLAVTVSLSVPGVSVALEKLLNQLSWVSTTSVCEPEDSGASVWPALFYTMADQ